MVDSMYLFDISFDYFLLFQLYFNYMSIEVRF